MSTSTVTAPPNETIWSIANGAIRTRCLFTAAELGVADQFDETPVSGRELALRCGADPVALERIMRLLVAEGIFAWDAGCYVHTPASRLLRDDHPNSMRAFVRMVGLPIMWSSLGALPAAAATGRTALDTIDAGGFWSHLKNHPDDARLFDAAMTSKGHAYVAAVLEAYDFSPFSTIADIGGGRGHLLHAVLEAVPRARGVLFDLPDVLDALPSQPARVGLHAGDFFVDPLPAADAYMLMEVLHDWPDADAIAILNAIRRAARPGAALLVIEAVLPEADLDPRARTLDVIMLAVTGGRERSAGELGELLAAAGFRLTAVVETSAAIRVAEAVAV